MLQPAPGKRVHYDATHRRFVLNGTVPLRGVTRVIATQFVPHFSESKATKGRDVVPEARASAEQKRQVRQVEPLSGRELGTLVDREVSAWVRLIWRYGLAPEQYTFLTQPPKVPVYLHAADAAQLVHLQHNSSLYTRRALRELELRGLVPVQSQCAVGSMDTRLGTAVDILATRKACVERLPNGTGFGLKPGSPLVIVELKCGFENTYHKHTGRNMRAPLAHLEDSYHMQHQLQLFLTGVLWQRTYRGSGHAIEASAILRVHAVGVSWYPARIWSPDEQRALWKSLEDSREQVSTTRRKRRKTQKLSAAARAAGGVYAPEASSEIRNRSAPKRRRRA